METNDVVMTARAVAVLLVGTSSRSFRETVARLLSRPGSSALTVRVMFTPALLASVPTVQRSNPASWLQLPTVELAETNTEPLGTQLLKTTPVAGAGPRLNTVLTKFTLRSSGTLGGAAIMVRLRSAPGAPSQQSVAAASMVRLHPSKLPP